jgi:hypothetical protein
MPISEELKSKILAPKFSIPKELWRNTLSEEDRYEAFLFAVMNNRSDALDSMIADSDEIYKMMSTDTDKKFECFEEAIKHDDGVIFRTLIRLTPEDKFWEFFDVAIHLDHPIGIEPRKTFRELLPGDITVVYDDKKNDPQRIEILKHTTNLGSGEDEITDLVGGYLGGFTPQAPDPTVNLGSAKSLDDTTKDKPRE